MSILSMTMILFSILFFILIIKLVNNATFSLDYALVWLALAVVLVIFSLFPGVPDWLGHLFGFELTSNFLLFMAVIFCLVQLIFCAKYFTKQNNQIKILIQELSLLKKEIERREQEK